MEPDVLLSRLRRAKPSFIRVHCQGRQEPDLLTVSTKRDRWSKAVDSLCAMDWHRLDCLDAQQHIIEIIATDDPDADAEGGAQVVVQSEEERWLNLMINAQRLALENQAAMLNPLIDGYKEMVGLFADRLTALEKHYDQTLGVAYNNALLQAQVDSKGDEDMETEIVKSLLDRLAPRKKVKGKKPAKELPAKSEDDENESD